METNEIDIKSKVFNVIRDARIKKYTDEEEELTQEGLTFLGMFNGKNSLKVESLKNLKLKIESLQKESWGEKRDYTNRDLMVELYSSAIVNFGGNFTPEMMDLYNELKQGCEGNIENIDEEIYLESISKLNNLSGMLTPDSANIAGIVGDRKNVIKFMRMENANIENKLIEVKPSKITGSF